MKQVWIARAGEPEVLEVREAADPSPGRGELLVDVRAAGINFADVMARMGLYPDAPPLPCVVGYEVAGVVREVGEGVERFAVGDRVVGLTRFGGYSSVVAAPEVQFDAIPERLSFVQAAAIPVNYLTAWIMLVELGNLKAGERVLVHAAAGGVGQAAVQIARWRKAEIFGTASAGKHARLKELGVDHCIDYRSQDFEKEVMRITGGKGVHVALDAVGGESFRKSYRTLGTFGRLFMFGVSSIVSGKRRSLFQALKTVIQMPRWQTRPLMDDNQGVFGINLGHLWDEQERIGTMLREIMGLVEEGVLEPIVDASFPHEDAAKAHHYIQDRKNFGKVILRFGED